MSDTIEIGDQVITIQPTYRPGIIGEVIRFDNKIYLRVRVIYDPDSFFSVGYELTLAQYGINRYMP